MKRDPLVDILSIATLAALVAVLVIPRTRCQFRPLVAPADALHVTSRQFW